MRRRRGGRAGRRSRSSASLPLHIAVFLPAPFTESNIFFPPSHPPTHRKRTETDRRHRCPPNPGRAPMPKAPRGNIRRMFPPTATSLSHPPLTFFGWGVERTPPLWKEMKELLPASFFFQARRGGERIFPRLISFVGAGWRAWLKVGGGWGERRRKKCLHQSARLSWARLVGLMMERDVALHGDGRTERRVGTPAWPFPHLRIYIGRVGGEGRPSSSESIWRPRSILLFLMAVDLAEGREGSTLYTTPHPRRQLPFSPYNRV